MSDFRNRLQTVDESGRRIWVYADILKAPWRKKRRFLAAFLVIFYLTLPWLSLNGLPLLQIDFEKQRFVILGQIFWLHELGILVPLFFAAIFLLFAVTSIWGRVWCGWGCPQTVFMEFIYRPIEKLVEGRPHTQRAVDQGPWNFNKYKVKTLKWALFGLVSFIVANSFLAYFVGSHSLITMMSSSPAANPGLFALMLFVNFAFLFNFGWFREQMCTIACPYGRLQSILIDKQTLIVGYDTKRGEPRGKNQKGDCVDCNRCVQVCPTGIDIRNGLQLECVNCTACIDACNVVMEKIGKPKNLISYTSETKLARSDVKQTPIRSIAYSLLALILIGASTFQIITRSLFEVEVVRSGSVQFEQIDQYFSNRIQLRLRNKTPATLHIAITSPEIDVQIVTAEKVIEVPAKQTKEFFAFVKVPISSFNSGIATRTLIYQDATGEKQETTLTLFGSKL